MGTQVYGIIMVICCLIGFIYSWREAFKENYKVAVLLLLALGFILRVFVSCDFYLHDWDEQFHALVAKNLMLHPLIPTLYDNPILDFDYKSWNSNHIWLHKQPLPLWSMAFSMSIFGVNEIALRLPSILLSTAGIYLTYAIGSYYFDKKSGYIAALLFAISGVIIEVTGGRIATDHVDVFFMFFILLGIYFSTRFARSPKLIFSLLIGISIGAAILCKWLPALIILPIWLLVVSESKSIQLKSILINLLIIISSCILVFLPWQLYINNIYPKESSWVSNLNFRHIFEVLDAQSGAWYYYLQRVGINYDELIYLPLIWLIWISFKRPLNLKYLSILLWISIPIIFFSVAKTKMQGYILFIAPVLFIITGYFWVLLKEYRKEHKFKWLINLFLVVLIALPIRYSIERIKPFSNVQREPQWVSKLKSLGERKIKKGVLFNYDKPISGMFYTDLTAYEQLPDKNTINDLIDKGYTVLINNTSKLTDDIRNINGVVIEDLGEINYPK